MIAALGDLKASSIVQVVSIEYRRALLRRNLAELRLDGHLGEHRNFDTRDGMRWLGCVVLGSLIAHANGTEKPVALYAGLGIWHHAIATKNSEAQKYFDQGLTLAWSFNRYEALRSFRRASELDPDAVMPYLGNGNGAGSVHKYGRRSEFRS